MIKIKLLTKTLCTKVWTRFLMITRYQHVKFIAGITLNKQHKINNNFACLLIIFWLFLLFFCCYDGAAKQCFNDSKTSILILFKTLSLEICLFHSCYFSLFEVMAVIWYIWYAPYSFAAVLTSESRRCCCYVEVYRPVGGINRAAHMTHIVCSSWRMLVWAFQLRMSACV